MAPELTNEAWMQIRHDYEHTDRPVEDICAEHGISSGTLRDRIRRWGWARRRTPIPRQGPPPAPPIARPLPRPDAAPALAIAPEAESAGFVPLPQAEAAAPCAFVAPQSATEDDPAALDETAILLRLQGAVARVLPAIEATVAKFAGGPMQAREMESAARALASLTRTLRQLNELLASRQAASKNSNDDDMPEDIDAFRFELARRIEAFVASREGQEDEGELEAAAQRGKDVDGRDKPGHDV